MSNMGPFGNNKNSPWARGAVGNTSMGQGPLQQQMLNQGAMGGAAMVQYQQGQVFQSPMGLQQQNIGMGLQQLGSPSVGINPGMGQQINPNQLFPQVGAVSYPNPRALNQAAFQTNLTSVNPVPNQQNNSTKQRVFTGTVTKVHDNFGFVDEDVFFQTTACVKGSNPQVGDRVLVEASFNPNMPFKWNATRIQVLPTSGNQNISQNNRNTQSQSTKNYNTSQGYNAVPPPMENSNGNYGISNRSNQNNKSNKSGIGNRRDRSRDRDRDDDEIERKRRREERTREREEKDKKSPLRRRSRSPKARRRARIVPRYMVQIPKIALHLPNADVLELRRRYTNLYVPSDFFSSQFRWIDAFPPHNPFALNKPCQFHIMNKDVDPVVENDAVLEPSDADYLFSAKVMLMSVPNMEEIYTKCCSITDDRERKERDSEERDFVHPTRLINFLVGLRGKNETMAIGGAWSPSLDGENPDKDPSVLIRTAIRTCKALTGIDLSNCTQWYRFVELYYRRSESSHRGKTIPARVETIVIYLPDVWTCLPTRLEWDQTLQTYKKQLERKIHHDSSPTSSSSEDTQTQQIDDPNSIDDKEDEIPSEGKLEPTHYSQLDPKVMSIQALRNELKARNNNSKGLKSQLIARLTKILKAESEKNISEDLENIEIDQNESKTEEKEVDTDKKVEETNRKLDEKEKQILEKKYNLPEEQHIIVHPSRVAKSGKFDCTVMSLSLLLDYRPEDTKEHSFEVSLFAELFNEMLMRDFGFNIYKAIHNQPEKVEEKKDEKKRKDEKEKDKSEKFDSKSVEKDQKSDKKEEETCDENEDDDKKDRASEKSRSSDKDRDRGRSKDKDKDKDKKEKRIKLITKDKNLLLSFVYFDTTHCGYIFEKDIEELIYTLELSLSRAQVRKLVSKVITRDSLHYRKLTDGPKDEVEIYEKDENTDNHKSVEELGFGNRKLLPIFRTENNLEVKGVEKMDESGSQTPEGFVMYQGALMDIGKLITQLSRSEKARLDTEQRMIELKKENSRLSEKNEKSSTTIKNLSSDLSDCKKKLQHSDDALSKVTSNSKLFHSTLLEIRDKIEPVITLGYKKEKESERDIDVKKENSYESRWESKNEEKEIKKEIKSENSEKNESTIVIQE